MKAVEIKSSATSSTKISHLKLINQSEFIDLPSSKYPPPEVGALRSLAPRRGLIAIEKNGGPSLFLGSDLNAPHEKMWGEIHILGFYA